MFWHGFLLLISAGFQPIIAAYACDYTRFYAPKMQTIHVPGDGIPTPTSDLDIFKTGNAMTEQIMTFTLSPEALGKGCKIGWSVPAASEREFFVQQSGSLKISEIMPDGSENYAFGADFTFWPSMEGGHYHRSGATSCKEELAFRLAPREDGKIFLKQNDHTGFYVGFCSTVKLENSG